MYSKYLREKCTFNPFNSNYSVLGKKQGCEVGDRGGILPSTCGRFSRNTHHIPNMGMSQLTV